MIESRSRTPLILLHGALGSAEQLSFLAGRLADHFEPHVLDLPGHGDAPLREQPFALASFVAHVRCYIEKHELAHPWIFGHSMGGLVALLLMLEQSCRLGGVITLGTKLGWTPEVASRAVSNLDPAKIEQQSPSFALVLERRHRALDWRLLLQYTQVLTGGLGVQPPLPMRRLPELNVPVFFGVAERDHLVSQEEARQVVGQLPKGRLWTIPGAHSLESVELDALAEQIRRFPASVDRA